MRQTFIICKLLSAISLLLPLAGYALSSNVPSESILDMQLEELLQVSVASKRLESVSDAPNVINVITAEDIRRYGARHLRDVIDRLPNAQVIGSSVFPHNRTSLRGVTQTHLDDKILILLNGRPLREAGQGGG